MPFRINIQAQCVVSLDALKENAATCDGLERIQKQEPHGRKVAICGGAPSLVENLQELKEWDGEIWAVNGTAKWLNDRGIKATFLTCDPGDFSAWDFTGVDDALIATCCRPDLRGRFKNCRLFDLCETHEGGMTGGTTSASRAISVALHLGYYEIHIFGCDGSFKLGNDHVDRHDDEQNILIVEAGGNQYATYMEYLLQCESLGSIMRLAPKVFKCRSGGLLKAVIDHPETWEIVAVSAAMKEHLEEVNGSQGLYETPFEVTQ